jgi:8-oxo-dGTP pyrophosphatase MutT (NUDIX family)
MSNWKTLKSEVVYETPWIKVQRDEVLNHHGKPMTYSFVSLHHPSVFIVALNDNNEVLLQQNYRYTIDQNIWEIPAGHSDGQELVVAAKRELLEESGLESDDWIDLGTAYQGAGVANMPMAILMAKSVRQVTTERDEDEEISQQRFIPFGEVERMIQDGEIVNSATIAALYKATLYNQLHEEM